MGKLIDELIVNGRSSVDFDFPIFVEQNDGFRFPKKKNKLIETEYSTGAIKDTVNAWPPIPKEYLLHCPTATLKDMRKIKLWAEDNGRLIAADEPDVFYEILDVEIPHSPIADTHGYQINIIFTVQPFGFELNPQVRTYQNGSTIVNHTNAPMYPRIDVYGNHNEQTSIQIGQQTIYLRRLQTKNTIECKYLEQNIFDQYGVPINSTMRGDFFEIHKNSSHVITLGTGIERIELLERWGWL